MRRPLAVLSTTACAALLGSLLVTAPAHASDRVFRMQFSFPQGSGVSFAKAPCAGSGPTGSAGSRQLSEVAQPEGTRSMQVSGAAVGTASGFTRESTSLVNEPFLRYDVNPTGPATTVTIMELRGSGALTTWRGSFNGSLPGAGWQSGEPLSATYFWTEYGPTGQATGETAYLMPQALRTAEGYTDASYSVTVGFGCAGETVRFDKIRYGSPGDQNVLDFEAYATQLGTSAAKSVVAGQSTTLATALDAVDDVTGTSEGVVGAEGALRLQRAEGAGFVDVPAVVAPASPGAYTATFTPAATGTYRWRYAGSTPFEPSVSSPFAVTVTAAPVVPVTRTLTAAPVEKKVKKGKQVVVEGQLSPADPGATVTLWRALGANDRALATGVVALDGRFRITTTARKPGRLKLYVSSASATSPTFTVKVRPRRR